MDNKTDLNLVKSKALQYAEIVKSHVNVKYMYLFGSYVRGTNDADSDIDIAVVSDDLSGDSFDDNIRLAKLNRDIDTMIEPHAFVVRDFDVRNPFVREIMETGIRLV